MSPPAPPKHKNSSAMSSEFIYLGTLVNSRPIEEQWRGGGPNSTRGVNNRSSGSISRKLDSPELRLLLPLVRQQQLQQQQEQQQRGSMKTTNVSSNTGDENEEEFYSLRGSFIRQAEQLDRGWIWIKEGILPCCGDGKIQGKIDKLSSSSSSSSSVSSGSPTRSASISISPPASLSPRRPKSPKLSAIEAW